ncbi:THA11-like protein, partial [Mya arenaria]
MGKHDFCCATGCSHNRSRGAECHFYNFPSDPKLRTAWLIKVSRVVKVNENGKNVTKEWTPSKSSKLCSCHFETPPPTKSRKKWFVIPSIFSHRPATSNRKSSRKAPKERETIPKQNVRRALYTAIPLGPAEPQECHELQIINEGNCLDRDPSPDVSLEEAEGHATDHIQQKSDNRMTSELNLVDLAGTETIKLTEASGERLKIIQSALKSRKVSQTAMNRLSSRSHLIISINIRTKDNRMTSELNLVDLAGTETIKLTEASGERLKIIQSALKSRKVSQTAMNRLSSRSHLIISINIRTKDNRMTSELNLVDLAGTETIKLTEASGERLKDNRMTSELNLVDLAGTETIKLTEASGERLK